MERMAKIIKYTVKPSKSIQFKPNELSVVHPSEYYLRFNEMCRKTVFQTNIMWIKI